MLNRRQLLSATALASAGVATGLPAGVASAAVVPEWVGAGEFSHIYDPSVPGQPAQYLNDHTVFAGRDGTWHMIGIIGDRAAPGQFPNNSNEIELAHATAPALAGPWTRRPHALTVNPAYFGETHLWAPHVIAHGDVYYMFYAAGGKANEVAINLATSTDLITWTRIRSGPLFRGLAARDPFVIRIGSQWVMYYCELAQAGGSHIVAARTSTDLLNWSAPRTVYTDPARSSNSASVTESPFVVSRNGWYYLFLGPRGGYTGTDVYASTNPMAFTPSQYAGHIPGHAVEVVSDGSGDWVTGCGVFQQGLYLAPLHWQSFAPPWQSRDNPALAVDVQGRLTAFAVDATDHSILRRVQSDPATDAWADWEIFGPPTGAVPTVGVNKDGRLEVFALGVNGANLTQRVQNVDGSWGAWQTFGGPAGAAPIVGRNADGRLEVFAVGPAGAYIAHRSQNRANASAGEWSNWSNFGPATAGPPVVGVNADGRMEVFSIGSSREHVAHRWQNAPSSGWSNWNQTFGPTPCGGVPTVARDPRGRLEVFALAPVGTGVNMRPQAAPNGSWSSWTGFSAWADAAPTVIASKDGRLEAFWIPPGGQTMFHRWQNNITDGIWSAPETFGTSWYVAAPSAAQDATGRIHVFAVAPDGSITKRRQTRPSRSWDPWQPFGTRRIATAPNGSAT